VLDVSETADSDHGVAYTVPDRRRLGARQACAAPPRQVRERGRGQRQGGGF
jgi:hypothetical protein